MPRLELRPQPGPQTAFCAASADLVVYGGEAGGGKTFAIVCLDPLRHTSNPGYRALLLRRQSTELFMADGMWDLASQVYPGLGAKPRLHPRPEWRFRTGSKIEFGHLNEESTKYTYQGAGYAYIGWDQLEHFTLGQFAYLLSRRRSTSGIRPHMRATINPDPGHFCRRMLDWWIYSKKDGVDEKLHGYPNPNRDGVLRYYVMDQNNEFHVSDDAEALRKRHGRKHRPISLSFIRARLKDNPALLAKDPTYESALENLTYVEQMRLQEGNWDIREGAGTIFKREWFRILEAAPECIDVVRYWDRGATPAERAKKGTSWTCGMLIGKTARNTYVIMDIVRFQGDPGEVERMIHNTATQDGPYVRPVFEQDPGQAGIMEARYQVTQLQGYEGSTNPVSDSKGIRARGPSAQAKVGNIFLVRAPWNDTFLQEAENFNGTQKDADQVDCLSGGFYVLNQPQVEVGVWGGRRR